RRCLGIRRRRGSAQADGPVPAAASAHPEPLTTTPDGIRANESGSELIWSGPDTVVMSLNDPVPDIRIRDSFGVTGGWLRGCATGCYWQRRMTTWLLIGKVRWDATWAVMRSLVAVRMCSHSGPAVRPIDSGGQLAMESRRTTGSPTRSVSPIS